MNQPDNTPIFWHTLSSDEAIQALESSSQGLSQSQAEQRLRENGPNRLRPPPRRSALRRFITQFNNTLIYVLLSASIITMLLQQWIDSSVILGVVLINALIGYIQEGKAEKALEAIRNMLSQQASVRRDNKLIILPAEQLVPGDVVFLQSGDKVPADLRLFHTKELQVDESILTGESVPINKQHQALSQEAQLAERSCMSYSGTLVTYGQASGLVVATGDDTEIGRINLMLSRVQSLTTPLLRQLTLFSRWLSGIILVCAIITMTFGLLFRDYTLTEMFLAAVGIAVAAIPESLPAIMTITLAIGVQRMAQRNAIIRRLPAVETLGAVTTICTDKTGTLTRNEMTVQSIITQEGRLKVTGSGYDPHGNFQRDHQEIEADELPITLQLIIAGMLCSDARVEKHEDQWRMQGDPTEGALITLGLKAGLELQHIQQAQPRTDTIPFESQHRFMATLHHDHARHSCIYLKGAPEKLLEICQYQQNSDGSAPIDHAFWHQQMENEAKQGHRVLALAIKPLATEQQLLNFADLENGLILLGMVGITDPPREEAIDAVTRCQQAGIRIIMITGDHATTAQVIGQQVGIHQSEHALTGRQLDEMDDQQLSEQIQQINIFARTRPEHKLRIVEALQNQSQVVAMTGDGVNDAPALKRADVGIAMGQKGTEVAKESSRMVLTDDNFASIGNAVEEGRTVYDNITKGILFILPTSIGEACILIAAIMMGVALPITPVQILWVNMITAVTLGLVLAFEPPESNVMKRPPRDSAQPILSRHLIWRALFVSLILLTGTFLLFLYTIQLGYSLEYARTVSINTLVMFEMFYLFNARFITAPVLNRNGMLGNPYALWSVSLLFIIQLGFTYMTPMQTLFGTTSLHIESWLQIALVASSVLFLVEIEKALLHRNKKNGD